MILVDLNQVLLSGLMAQISGQKNVNLEEDLIRHMILNILRNHIKNFKNEYGEVVLCCDNRRYWRKDFFPFYKASRKKNREKSNLDWHLIFDMLAKFKEELKENFPYKVVDVEGAEADDIIGTLVPRHIAHENILIISSDGDFLQLQRYNSDKYTVKQYNPAQKKYLKSEDPLVELKQKIIQGDRGDGIPNILSPGDSFVREIQQKRLTKNSLAKFLSEDIVSNNNDYVKAGFLRNQTLIDLAFIPTDIKEKIINNYEESKPAPKNKLFTYFVEKKLMNLIDSIGEF
jgi:5'-3' exonuclease